MPLNSEGGLRPSRIEFVGEDEEGVIPDGASWSLISDRITEFEAEFGPEAVDKAGIGQHDNEYAPGLEENELTLSYDMQRWLVDNNGEPDSVLAYGMLRDAVGHLPGTVSVVERSATHKDGDGYPNAVESTVHYDYINDGNATPRHSHLYTVARGCTVDEASLEGDPEEVYWAAESTLLCTGGRSYQFDQPDTSQGGVDGTLIIKAVPSDDIDGTNPEDAGLPLTIESENATTAEDLTLDDADASVGVTTTNTYESIDSIATQGQVDHFGDVLVYEARSNDSGGYDTNQLLGVLFGYGHYDNTHGDYGTPVLGAGGTHGTEIGSTITGTDYFAVGNSLVERPAGRAFELAGSVNSVEIELENDSGSVPDNNSRENLYRPAMRSTEITLSCDGETVSHRAMKQAAALEKLDTVVLFDRAGNLALRFPSAPMGESPRNRNAGENALEMEFSIMSGEEGVSATSPN